MERARGSYGRSREPFSVRLKRLRLHAGLTQKDLERLSDIPKSRISRYENGHLHPSFQGLRRLAKSLGVTESALLSESEDPMTTLLAELRRHGVSVESTEDAVELAQQVAEVVRRRRLKRAT